MRILFTLATQATTALAAGSTFTMADVRARHLRYEAHTDRVSARSANDTFRLAVRDAQGHAPSDALAITIVLDELLFVSYTLLNKKPGALLQVYANSTQRAVKYARAAVA